MALPGPGAVTDHGPIVQVDSLFLVLVTAGVLLAVGAAVLVGTLAARLLFNASRGEVE